MGCVDDLGRFGESLLAGVDHRRESIVAFAFHESFGALVDLGADQYEFTMHADGDPEREIHLTLIPFALRPTAEASTPTSP